jgi:hypothetical protein
MTLAFIDQLARVMGKGIYSVDKNTVKCEDCCERFRYMSGLFQHAENSSCTVDSHNRMITDLWMLVVDASA